MNRMFRLYSIHFFRFLVKRFWLCNKTRFSCSEMISSLTAQSVIALSLHRCRYFDVTEAQVTATVNHWVAGTSPARGAKNTKPQKFNASGAFYWGYSPSSLTAFSSNSSRTITTFVLVSIEIQAWELFSPDNSSQSIPLAKTRGLFEMIEGVVSFVRMWRLQ